MWGEKKFSFTLLCSGSWAVWIKFTKNIPQKQANKQNKTKTKIMEESNLDLFIFLYVQEFTVKKWNSKFLDVRASILF